MMIKAALAESPWPQKLALFGVELSAVNQETACDAVLSAANRRQSAVVSAFSVHALIEAASSPELRAEVNRFAMIVPDGQPVRWALNWLHRAGLSHNVRGSDLMEQLCERAADYGVSIYLYGSTPTTLTALREQLARRFPRLVIAGAESPPFRPLSQAELDDLAKRVSASGAGLILVGLGCPKQDWFAAANRERLAAVQVCVGAAFDFLAGTKPTAPPWMQRRGLEWIFRLYQEPRRLWRRYLVTNTRFVIRLMAELACHAFRRTTTSRPLAPIGASATSTSVEELAARRIG